MDQSELRDWKNSFQKCSSLAGLALWTDVQTDGQTLKNMPFIQEDQTKCQVQPQ